MDFKNKTVTALFGLFLTTASFGQTAKPTEYLGVGRAITFDKVSYNLAWTSHPADNYYKQEYLAKGSTLEKFEKLIMLDVITGKIKIEDVVAAKITEIKKIKSGGKL